VVGIEALGRELFSATFEDAGGKRKNENRVICSMAPGRVNVIGEHTGKYISFKWNNSS